MAVITIGRVLNKGSDSVSVVRDPTDATALLSKTIDTVSVTRDTEDTSRWATGNWFQMVPAEFDTITLTYVGETENIHTAVYRQGGPTGTIIATLTLGYDENERLNSVQRS